MPSDVVESIKRRCDINGFVNDKKYMKGEKVKFLKNNQISLDAVFEEQIDKKRSFVFINFLNQQVKATVVTRYLEASV